MRGFKIEVQKSSTPIWPARICRLLYYLKICVKGQLFLKKLSPRHRKKYKITGLLLNTCVSVLLQYMLILLQISGLFFNTPLKLMYEYMVQMLNLKVSPVSSICWLCTLRLLSVSLGWLCDYPLCLYFDSAPVSVSKSILCSFRLCLYFDSAAFICVNLLTLQM
jgi:hypothetical protein